MRMVVDLNRCQGYAQCCFLAPEAFKLVGDEALMYNPAPDDALAEKIMRAAAACPVQAITVERIKRRPIGNKQQERSKEVVDGH